MVAGKETTSRKLIPAPLPINKFHGGHNLIDMSNIGDLSHAVSAQKAQKVKRKALTSLDSIDTFFENIIDGMAKNDDHEIFELVKDRKRLEKFGIKYQDSKVVTEETKDHPE